MEGWRKIPPLMDIVEQNIPTEVQKGIKLEMSQKGPIFDYHDFLYALKKLDSAHLGLRDSTNTLPILYHTGKTIKDSCIYKHFTKLRNRSEQTNQPKIALYVSEVIPINQNFDASKINSVGNHCVIASGLAKWPKDDPNGTECLELETHGDSDEMRYIPVDFPFFEEIQIDINEIYQKTKNRGIDIYNREMNKLGKKLARKKWNKWKIEDNWYDLKKKPKEGQDEADKAKQPWKYGMNFVRGIHPCFQLKFSS